MPSSALGDRLAFVLRFWFTFERPVNATEYFRHGFALALLKYVVDAALILAVTGVVWTPLDYLVTGTAVSTSKLGFAPMPLLIVLALWTLPFFWIGETMSVRRVLDAGHSPWLALLFFVPLVNYAFMLVMSVMPSAAPRANGNAPPDRAENFQRSAVIAGSAGLAVGLGMTAFSVFALRNYGFALFLGTPFLIGAITAFLLNRRTPTTLRRTAVVVLGTLLALAGGMLLLAIEGVACIIMASPLAFGIAMLGATIGRRIALGGERSLRGAAFAVALLPVSAPLMDLGPPAPLREVRTVVEVDAPPSEVWRHVIAFSPLPAPTELIFRIGIAYPVAARIDGTGVGAVRHCEFSTGAFVEPIRAWEPGRRLAFDVSASPPPLRELSLYSRVTVPHLDGYFAARRGEFRLFPLSDGRTRLEGSTWYDLRLQPTAYWSVVAEFLVHRIHYRVLRHVRAQSEAAAAESAPAR
jgi:uncharacterized membrane protein YhaH (DUF805 family)